MIVNTQIIGKNQNCKSFKITLESAITTTTTLVSADPDVAKHCADDSAFCSLNSLNPIVTVEHIRTMIQSNMLIGSTYYAFRYQYAGVWSDAFSGVALKNGNQAYNCLYASPSGDIQLVCNGRGLLAGTYHIVFSW